MKKRKKTKKIITISILSLLIMITGYSAFNTNISLSAKGNVYDKGDLCYETSDNGDGTVTITDYDKTCGSEVIIPSTIKGKTVTAIESTPWNVSKSFNHKGLTKVVIPDTVKYIYSCAFYGNKITSLDLGNGIYKIEGEAFGGNELTYVKLPASLKELYRGAFENNKLTHIPNLENLTFLGTGAFWGNEVPDDEAFVYGRNSDRTIDYTILNSYAGGWHDTLDIPSTVKTLPYYSLRDVKTSTLNLPEGLENIENGALMLINNTKVVNIPSTIKTIGSGAFSQTYTELTINIKRKENAIEGAPWGATNATINWIGNN